MPWPCSCAWRYAAAALADKFKGAVAVSNGGVNAMAFAFADGVQMQMVMAGDRIHLGWAFIQQGVGSQCVMFQQLVAKTALQTAGLRKCALWE